VTRRYATLKDGPNLDEATALIDDSLEEVDVRFGLSFAYAGEEETEGAAGRMWQADRGFLYLAQDELAGLSSLVEGEEDGVVNATADFLFERLGAERLEDLKARARRADDPRALMRLALAQGDSLDAESVDILRRGLGSDDPAVLGGALMAVATTRSPAFAGDLDALRQRPLDDELRERLDVALQNCLEGTP
jgi:hypothetical protein